MDIAEQQRTRELAPETWPARLHELGLARRGSPTALATGEHGSGGLHLPLRSIEFDARTAVLEVALGGSAGHGPALRCLVAEPERVVLQEAAGALRLAVQEHDGPGLVIVVGRTVPGAARAGPAGTCAGGARRALGRRPRRRRP